jgi:hypothetical protein
MIVIQGFFCLKLYPGQVSNNCFESLRNAIYYAVDTAYGEEFCQLKNL